MRGAAPGGRGLLARCGVVRYVPQLIVLSLFPEASVRPSGENATELQHWHVPSMCHSCPLAASQSFIVSSPLPEAIVRPSGENATDTPITRMSRQRAQRLAGRGIPELDRVVPAPRADRAPVRRKRDDGQSMSRQRAQSCPSNSQSFIVLSPLPDAIVRRPAKTPRN